MTRRSLALAVLLLGTLTVSAQDFSARFASPEWDGVSIPQGQQCRGQGGAGATPPIALANVPHGTAMIVLKFNDEDFEPFRDAGHGTFGFAVEPHATELVLPAVEGETESLPDGVTMLAPNKTSGDWLRPGYIPPCSGQGHSYTVDIEAVDDGGRVLASTNLTLGTF